MTALYNKKNNGLEGSNSQSSSQSNKVVRISVDTYKILESLKKRYMKKYGESISFDKIIQYFMVEVTEKLDKND